MKRTTPLFVVVSLLLLTGFSSCSNYGKKIKVDGTKGEVYYKDGATESDARKIGDFLKENSFFNNEKGASVQATKQGEDYLIRFVYSKDYYDKTGGLEDVFKECGVKMSKKIFDGKKVNIALTDNNFKDFKTIPYDEGRAQ